MAGLQKLFIAKYTGKVAAGWKHGLGIEIAGNESFSVTDTRRRNPRKVCLPIVEGLAAVCFDLVHGSHRDSGGRIWVKLEPQAYVESHTTACLDQPVPRPGTFGVGYLDRGRSQIGSSFPSTSGRGSKTEISIAATGLIEALLLLREQKSETARKLLEAHCALLRDVEVATASSGGQVAGLPLRVKDVADRIYSWICYYGHSPKDSPVSEITFGPVAFWPLAGDAADELASAASGSLHEIISSASRLEAELGGTRPVHSAPSVADPESALQRAIRWAGEVGQAILFAGPASTGKTRAMLSARDQMPVVRTSMTAESDIALAVGDLGRSASGEWTPQLGRLSHVVRYAMLAAIIVALRRGAQLGRDWTRSPFAAPDTVEAIERLAVHADDPEAIRLLDAHAWPYDPASWDQVNAAWMATGAARVGPTVRLVLDEIHDAATANSDFQTLLKLALEDERVFLTELGGAGWRPMYCHNVHVTAAGNPDERGQFGRALRSRFAYTVAVGYPTRDEEIRWHQASFTGNPETVRITSARPISITDGVWEPRVTPTRALSESEIRAAVDLGVWSREQYSAGRLAEGLDPAWRSGRVPDDGASVGSGRHQCTRRFRRIGRARCRPVGRNDGNGTSGREPTRSGHPEGRAARKGDLTMYLTLTILDLPRRRAWLESGIGAKVRDLFGRDRARPLPSVEFVTPDEARARRLPSTSWYRFDQERIGIYLEPLPDAAREWERLEHHTLHELLHWTWNFSATLSGASDQIDHTLANIFADAANEQRAGLSNPWARGVVARGRKLLVPDLFADSQPQDALWAAALLTLRAHTCLAAKGWAILDALSDRDDLEAATAVWNRIAGEIAPPTPAVTRVWDRAFAVAWKAWRSDNQFDLVDAVGEFRSLFPTPAAAEPPSSPFGLDAHEGDRAPGDSEAQPSPRGTTRPATPGHESAEAPELGEDADSGAGEDVATELEALSAAAGIWRPVAPKLRHAATEAVRPRPGRDLLAIAQADGVELGRRIKASRAPRLRTKSERGRAVARIIAREPDASRPFRSRTSSEPELTPDVFVAVVIDTSGSMSDRGKIAAARRAAATVAVACETARAPYAIVTSRRALHVGGDGLDLARTSALLAGVAADGGDGLSATLGPILEAVSERAEPVRVAIVLQDGEPCDPAAVRRVVDAHRSRGAVIVAVGLDLTESEASGLANVFGAGACLTTAGRLVRDLGEAVSAAIARSLRQVA